MLLCVQMISTIMIFVWISYDKCSTFCDLVSSYWDRYRRSENNRKDTWKHMQKESIIDISKKYFFLSFSSLSLIFMFYEIFITILIVLSFFNNQLFMLLSPKKISIYMILKCALLNFFSFASLSSHHPRSCAHKRRIKQL